MSEIPNRVAIVGAGYIAVELAGIMRGLGAEVHLIIRRSTFLREFDTEIISKLRVEMESSGVIIHHDTTTKKVEKSEDGSLKLISTDDKMICHVDKLIWAIGRHPLTHDLNLSVANVKVNSMSGCIEVDEFQNTSTKGIYALGDVCGNIELTPVAIAAGRALAERLFNNQPESKFDYDCVPTVIFSHPPLGTCGLSEEQAKQKYGEDTVRVFKASFVNMYYAMFPTEKKTENFYENDYHGPR